MGVALLSRQKWAYCIVLCCILVSGVAVAQAAELAPVLSSAGVTLKNRVAEPGFSFTPRLTVSELYSDNITLAPSDAEKSDFVTVIEPGISASFNGNRLDFVFDYTMQNLLYAHNSEFNDTNHQLDLDATAEFFRDRLFLDMNGSLSQQSVDTEEQLSDDNIADSDNRRDVTTFSLSPYYKNDFFGYVETDVRYTYGIVRFSGDGAPNDASMTESKSPSDVEDKRLEINLTNGRRVDRTTWEVDFFKQDLNRDGGQNADSDSSSNDSERESLTARADYRLSREWRIAARGGYENNDLASDSNQDESDNGGYWSIGGVWTPSRFLELEAFYGPSDNEIAVRLAPTTRTSIKLSRRDRDVGVDTGEIFSGSLQHRTRYTVWTASYTEETTSTQELELASVRTGGDELIDDNGQVVLPDDLDERGNLINEEFFRKRFNFSFAYSRGRSLITINSFFEDRQFNTDTADEKTSGADARWVWRLGAKTNSFIDLRWERNETGDTSTVNNSTQNDSNGDNNLWRLAVGLQHNFTERLNAGAEYSYARRDADFSQDDYRENRVTLLLRMEF